MTFNSTIDPALRIKPELVLQVLGSIPPLELEATNTLFKTKRNINNTVVTRELVAETVKAIPFVSSKSHGVSLNGKTTTYDGISVPPMKAHKRIEADEFIAAKNLKGKDYNAWLREQLVSIRKNISWNIEWLCRHFLTDGNCDYKMLIGDEWNALVYSLGTMTAAPAAPTVLFDNASAKLSDVVKHLDTMYETGKDVPGGYFQDSNNIVTYARKEVWNAILDILDARQTIDVLGSRRVNKTDLLIGDYLVRKFDGEIVDPQTQAAGKAITAKQMRMVDVSAGAPHTLVHLELANLKATGGQKHVLIDPVVDPDGDFVDIKVQFRPVGLFIPEAMVNSLNVIS